MIIKKRNGEQKEITLGRVSLLYTSKALQNIDFFKTQFAYGHREILLDYMDIDHSHLLVGVLQHGFTSTLEPWEANTPRTKAFFGRSPLWVYSEERVRGLRNLGFRNVSAIGAPWLYLPGDNGLYLNRENNESFIIFPNHTTLSILPLSEAEIRIKVKTWKIIAGNSPITICLYWSDFLQSAWKNVSIENGVSITLAGLGELTQPWSPHPSRLNYLHNLRNLLSGHTHAIFETFTSAIFYAAFEGLSIAYFQETLTPREKLTFNFLSGEPWFRAEMPDIVSKFSEAANLQECWSKMMGVNSKLSPENLQAHLEMEANYVPVTLA